MQPDVIIIGSGMGGATLAAALAESGRQIIVLERGERLADCPQARDPEAIFRDGYFRPDEMWLDGHGQQFNPGNYYYVGGNSKFFGAALIRYRAEDFGPMTHIGGTTPGWPITYDEIEPWYSRAEALYQVRGKLGEDPTEPHHSSSYAFPPVPDEPDIADFRSRLKAAGLNPSTLPLGVDLDRWLKRAKTPWDAFPDTVGGKMDGETVGIAAALRHPNVRLETGTKVLRLEVKDKRITGLVVQKGDQVQTMTAPVIVLAAGAVNTAAILLGSANADYPAGIANSSDQVGRNFMNHNCSAVLALHPLRKNRSVYQKTFQVNDFYLNGGPDDMPLGNIQLLGRVSRPVLAASSGLPNWLAGIIADRAIDLYAMSEDLPSPDSRVALRNGQIMLDWKRSNWKAHELLVAQLKRSLRKAGYPIILSKPFDRRTPSHQCGTARMGRDPGASVVDIWGKSHDHPNLFIADASVLPTSAAVNPALTIAAHALRVAHRITQGGAE